MERGRSLQEDETTGESDQSGARRKERASAPSTNAFNARRSRTSTHCELNTTMHASCPMVAPQ